MFGQMIKLVVIDDQEALRDGLVTLLGQAGIEVVATAASALSAADSVQHSEPDVALISTSLPDDHALTLTRELMAEHPGLAVILYSEDVGPGALREGLASGANGYALKRGSLDELTEAITRVAEGGSYVDPRLGQRVDPDQRFDTPPRLSPREREVLGLMAQGLTAEAVGQRLGVSVETVRTHTRNAIRKTGARNRVHAITRSLMNGEIQLVEG